MRLLTTLGYTINGLATALSLYLFATFIYYPSLPLSEAYIFLCTLWIPLGPLAIWAMYKKHGKVLLLCSFAFSPPSIALALFYPSWFSWVCILPVSINATLAVACMQKTREIFHRTGWLLFFANITSFVAIALDTCFLLLIISPNRYWPIYSLALTDPFFLMGMVGPIVSCCCLVSLFFRSRRLLFVSTLCLAAITLWLAAPIMGTILFTSRGTFLSDESFWLVFFAILFGTMYINGRTVLKKGTAL